MSDGAMATDDEFQSTMEPIGGTKVAPAVGIAAIALNFALKYHGISIVSDGTLYQQYKLEGRNMRELHLSDVFETAIRMEAHLLASEKRIAALIVDALSASIEAEDEEHTAGEGGSDA